MRFHDNNNIIVWKNLAFETKWYVHRYEYCTYCYYHHLIFLICSSSLGFRMNDYKLTGNHGKHHSIN